MEPKSGANTLECTPTTTLQSIDYLPKYTEKMAHSMPITVELMLDSIEIILFSRCSFHHAFLMSSAIIQWFARLNDTCLHCERNIQWVWTIYQFLLNSLCRVGQNGNELSMIWQWIHYERAWIIEWIGRDLYWFGNEKSRRIIINSIYSLMNCNDK